MKGARGGWTRRDFLSNAVSLALVGAAAGQKVLAAKPAAAARANSRVVLIRDPKALGAGGKPDPTVLARMLDEGVCALFDEKKPEAAWGHVASAADVVGIKSNAWRFLPTPGELEQLIQDRLRGRGVLPENLAVDDRGVRQNPVFKRSTVLVNVRPLRTHHWAGVGSCIKNYIMFAETPSSWHEDACANLAGLWELPAVSGKTRLNILVMLNPLFHGKGPHDFQAQYTWPYQGLLLGVDPVAVDATGVRILEAKRRAHFGKDEPFVTSPKHIRVAQDKFKLGIADPRQIELRKLGWMADALI